MRQHTFLLLMLPLLIVPLLRPAGQPALPADTLFSAPVRLTPTATPAPTAALAEANVDMVNHLDGLAEAVFVEGNYVYANFGPELAVLDISTPVQPVRVGYTILPDQIRQIQVAGRYAYVITVQGSLYVVDIADPTAPQPVDMYNPPDSINRLALDGDYAYLATRPEWHGRDQWQGGGLRIVDISSPSAPREVGFYDMGAEVSDVALARDGAATPPKIYAYIAAAENTPRLLDVSDPGAPRAVAVSADWPYYSRIAIANGYAYLMGTKTLSVLDVTRPTGPSEMGLVRTWGWLTGLSLAGHEVYLIDREGGGRHSSLVVIDVADPARPTRTASLGRSGLADLIERTCRHATRFAEGLRAAGYQVLNDMVLNQVLVSFGEAETTQRVIAALQGEGSCWCGRTVWQGHTTMRISVFSWATTEADVEQSLAAIIRVAAEQGGVTGANT
ncbi:MAG: hypothetical protein AB1801_09855 [Chloroflexota bacterium]